MRIYAFYLLRFDLFWVSFERVQGTSYFCNRLCQCQCRGTSKTMGRTVGKYDYFSMEVLFFYSTLSEYCYCKCIGCTFSPML